MAWVTIPDEEIEPEKPATSILFHKLRDNPEAIAGNLPGAPPIQGAGLVDLTVAGTKLVNATIPASKLLGAVTSFSTTDTTGQWIVPGGRHSMMMSLWATAPVAAANQIGNWSLQGSTHIVPATETLVMTLYVNTIGTTKYLNIWAYQASYLTAGYWYYEGLRDLDPTIKYNCFAQNALSWGHINNDDIPAHPFLSAEPGDTIKGAYITEAQYQDIKIMTMPVAGGGYMTPAQYLADPLTPLDMTRPLRQIMDVIQAEYNMVAGAIWPADPFPRMAHPMDPNTILMEPVPAPDGVTMCNLIPI